MPAKVVNIRKYVGSYVYIGRPSIWGNPYNIGPDGTREEVIAKYEEYVREKPELMAKIHTLSNATLGCWCKPKECHGDILVKLILEDEQLNASKTTRD